MIAKTIKTLTIATLLATSVSAFSEETIEEALNLGTCQVKILQDVIFTRNSEVGRITNSKGSILDVALKESMVSNDVRRIKAGRKLKVKLTFNVGNGNHIFYSKSDRSIHTITYKSIGAESKLDASEISVNTFNQRFKDLASISCSNSSIIDI